MDGIVPSGAGKPDCSPASTEGSKMVEALRRLALTLTVLPA
jgi:hypothetical protein